MPSSEQAKEKICSHTSGGSDSIGNGGGRVERSAVVLDHRFDVAPTFIGQSNKYLGGRPDKMQIKNHRCISDSRGTIDIAENSKMYY